MLINFLFLIKRSRRIYIHKSFKILSVILTCFFSFPRFRLSIVINCQDNHYNTKTAPYYGASIKDSVTKTTFKPNWFAIISLKRCYFGYNHFHHRMCLWIQKWFTYLKLGLKSFHFCKSPGISLYCCCWYLSYHGHWKILKKKTFIIPNKTKAFSVYLHPGNSHYHRHKFTVQFENVESSSSSMDRTKG